MVQKWKQAPENTLESLQHAIRVNDGIEFDLRLTSDQELVLHHDADISGASIETTTLSEMDRKPYAR
jgi:glycerophosphoryl diester phosphodiesterase